MGRKIVALQLLVIQEGSVLSLLEFEKSGDVGLNRIGPSDHGDGYHHCHMQLYTYPHTSLVYGEFCRGGR